MWYKQVESATAHFVECINRLVSLNLQLIELVERHYLSQDKNGIAPETFISYGTRSDFGSGNPM